MRQFDEPPKLSLGSATMRETPIERGSFDGRLTTLVVGGALVINHQIRSKPHSRSTKPDSRPEFLSAQTEPVIATPALVAAWCNEDSDAIQRLIFPEAEPSAASVPTSGAQVEGRPTPAKRSRWFHR